MLSDDFLSLANHSLYLLTLTGGGAHRGVARGRGGSTGGNEELLVGIQEEAMQKPKSQLMVQDFMDFLLYPTG